MFIVITIIELLLVILEIVLCLECLHGTKVLCVMQSLHGIKVFCAMQSLYKMHSPNAMRITHILCMKPYNCF